MYLACVDCVGCRFNSQDHLRKHQPDTLEVMDQKKWPDQYSSIHCLAFRGLNTGFELSVVSLESPRSKIESEVKV